LLNPFHRQQPLNNVQAVYSFGPELPILTGQSTHLAPDVSNSSIGTVSPETGTDTLTGSSNDAALVGSLGTDASVSAANTEISLSNDTLLGAANLGTLRGNLNFNNQISKDDPGDYFTFQLDTPSDLDLTLSGMTADADLYLFQDFNSNGVFDTSEIIAYSNLFGNSPESISLLAQAPGSYYLYVDRYKGKTNYTLTLTSDGAGEGLPTARNLGLLERGSVVSDFVGSGDRLDVYRSQLNTTSDVSLNLTRLSADADLYLIQDFNNDGVAESSEILASSIVTGNSAEAITFNGLSPGNYFVAVGQYSGDTNYLLGLAASPLGGLRLAAGTLWADTFTYTPGFSYSVFSGNGNVNFGDGGRDVIDLSNQFSSSIILNLATVPSGGVLFDPGNGTRVFDGITLSDGSQILFEGIDSILFADGMLNLAEVPNDPLFWEQWNLHMMGVQNAWGFTTGSPNVLIGVQDSGLATGIDGSDNIHPDLGADTPRVNGNYTDESQPFDDDYGHGTAVQGIIAAETNNGSGISGINWNSPVVNIDVLGGDEGDLNLGESTQIMIDQALRNGQRLVINLSLENLDPMFRDPLFEQLIANYQNSVLFVIASGNGNNNSLAYPAILANLYSNVIAVGASWGTEDRGGNPQIPGTRIFYPDSEPDTWGSNYGFGLTLMAPSEVLTTTVTPSSFGGNFTYDNFWGTSAAAPNVAGVASLVWSVNPNLTAAQVRAILQETAYDLGSPGYDLEYGSGMVNADAAIRRAIALA
jgi:subtilisin family serine protease